MEPEDLIFDGGMHPRHECSAPAHLLANLQWFARQWRLLAMGGVLATDACRYVKTPTGFRRLGDAEATPGAVPTEEKKDDHIA